jgi:hypothetical protein
MKWGWLFDNLGLKLFALLLAILLYLHVLTDRTVEETVSFPLAVTGLPDSLALAAAPPPALSARLRGSGKQILRLRYLKPPLELSLADVSVGTYQKTFGPADVPLPGATGVSVLEILEPARMTLEVAARGDRRVPVVVTTSGVPLRGFVAGEPVVRPPLVRLSGPADWLAAQDSVATQPIVLAGRRETIEVMQALVASPGFARATPGSVLVTVPIEPEETRRLSVPLEIRGIRGELRAEPQPAAITVTWTGPVSGADALDAGAYTARIDAGRKGRGEWLLPVEITGPGLGGPRPVAVARPESVRVVLH